MGTLKGYLIGIIVVAIVMIILDYRAKNFTSELHNTKVYISIYITMGASMLYFGSIDTGILRNSIYFGGLIVISAVYMLFGKSKIYHLKGMDKKLIKRNTDEISKIITDYKNNNLSEESQITFIGRRIIFEGVDKSAITECLSLVGEYLDEKRAYAVRDYVFYYLRSTILPALILIAFTLFLFRNVINIL